VSLSDPYEFLFDSGGRMNLTDTNCSNSHAPSTQFKHHNLTLSKKTLKCWIDRARLPESKVSLVLPPSFPTKRILYYLRLSALAYLVSTRSFHPSLIALRIRFDLSTPPLLLASTLSLPSRSLSNRQSLNVRITSVERSISTIHLRTLLLSLAIK